MSIREIPPESFYATASLPFLDPDLVPDLVPDLHEGPVFVDEGEVPSSVSDERRGAVDYAEYPWPSVKAFSIVDPRTLRTPASSDIRGDVRLSSKYEMFRDVANIPLSQQQVQLSQFFSRHSYPRSDLLSNYIKLAGLCGTLLAFASRCAPPTTIQKVIEENPSDQEAFKLFLKYAKHLNSSLSENGN